MMGSNMLGGQTPQINMMGNLEYFGPWNFLNVLYVILLIGLIILVFLGIIKPKGDKRKREDKERCTQNY